MMHLNYPWRLALLVMLASVLVSACAATMGQTTRRAVEVDRALTTAPIQPVQVKTVDVDSAGIQLLSVHVQPWGRFDANDLQNIRGSLEDTIGAATRSRGSSGNGSGEIQVRLVIRGYFVAASNNAGGVLAVADWCVADQDERVLYQEVFYASHAARLVGTLGGEKDAVNQAMVRRVAETSLLLASGADVDRLPRKVKNTYDGFEEAVKILPAEFQSFGVAGGASPAENLVLMLVPNSPSTPANWESVKVEQPINWSQRLGTKPAHWRSAG